MTNPRKKSPAEKIIINRRTKAAGEARARALWVARIESEYEIEMNERIITVSAEIRAEWDEHTRQSRLVGKPQDFIIPRSRGGSSRINGKDAQ